MPDLKPLNLTDAITKLDKQEATKIKILLEARVISLSTEEGAQTYLKDQINLLESHILKCKDKQDTPTKLSMKSFLKAILNKIKTRGTEEVQLEINRCSKQLTKLDIQLESR